MKKTFLIAVLATLIGSSAFAHNGEEQVTEAIKTAFRQDFKQASAIQWEKRGDLFLGKFEMNQEKLEVLYHPEGTLAAVSRVIPTNQMPLAIQLTLRQRFDGYDVPTQVTEINHDGITNYYFPIANDRQVLRLKASTSGDVAIEEKAKRQ